MMHIRVIALIVAIGFMTAALGGAIIVSQQKVREARAQPDLMLLATAIETRVFSGLCGFNYSLEAVIAWINKHDQGLAEAFYTPEQLDRFSRSISDQATLRFVRASERHRYLMCQGQIERASTNNFLR